MQRATSRFDFMTDREAAPSRTCDSPGCSGEGAYRAPKAPDRLRDYHWFCLDHVREYNKSWNFCAGLTESQIESLIRNDTLWERSTRPMSAWHAHEQRLKAAASAYAAGEERRARAEWASGAGARASYARREPETPEAAALKVLGLSPPVDYVTIRARYKELVKIHHPDANGGDKTAEERLKIINAALQTLKAAYLS